ncbi:MAG: hypothetical protein LBB85_11635 [Dysgonamonadaceae bacterium]|jgi:hypothetical protein|nr:hypothetical protein [Dysgonamonadaceae bacterium]
MGALEQAIENAIGVQADRRQIKQIITGTAMNVGETACDVMRENAPVIYDARLNAIDDKLASYVTVVPKAGSFVLVGIVENLKTEAVVLRCSEVEKVRIKIGDQTLTVDKEGFVINGGENAGLIKINSIVSWMQKVYSDLQTLKTQLATHPVAGNGAVLALSFNPTTQNPLVSDFEDEKIRH